METILLSLLVSFLIVQVGIVFVVVFVQLFGIIVEKNIDIFWARKIWRVVERILSKK